MISEFHEVVSYNSKLDPPKIAFLLVQKLTNYFESLFKTKIHFSLP